MARETVAGKDRGQMTPRAEGMRRERRARGCVRRVLLAVTAIMVLAVASARSVGATAGRGEYRRRRQQLARTMPEISAWKLRNMVDRTRFVHDDGLVKDTMTSGNVRDRVEEKKEKEEKKEEEDEEEKEEEEEEEEDEEE